MNARAVVFGVLLVLLCALQVTPRVGVGVALAQAADPCMSSTASLITCQTRENAWNRCQLKVSGVKAAHPTWVPVCYFHSNTNPDTYLCYVDHDSGTGCGGYGGIAGGSSGFAWAAQCGSGETWDDTLKVCKSAAKCLAKPALGFSKIVSATGVFTACSAGCRYEPSGSDMALGNDDGSYTSYTTGWKPTGAFCVAGDASPTSLSTLQDCVPAGAGQSFCIKPNGDHCYTVTSTSKQICWKPRETGEKASGDKLQVRNAGATATTPTTPPPAGDSIAPIGTSVTKTETVNGTTVVTTTTNYATTYGSQAGASDQGEPADGSGSPAGGGSGDGNGDGTATGGDCPAAWSCSGDEVGCAILAEEHQQRCATEGLNAELQAGTGDFGGDGNPDDAFGLSSLGSDTLDSSGFLSRSDCPAPVEIPGLSGLNLNAAVCPGASIWAVYMLIGAYIQAAYIIGRAAAGGSA